MSEAETPPPTGDVVFAAEFGGSLEAAARSAGVAPRTLRRWREQGRRELDELSDQGHLVLELDRVVEAGKALGWETTARMLDAEFGRAALDAS